MATGGTETSLRQLARLIGVSEKAVRKARQRGVFSSHAVAMDEGGAPVVVDLALAVAEWERSGRQLRGSVGRRSTEAPTAAPAPAPTEPAPVPSAPANVATPAEPESPPDPSAASPPEPRNLVDAQRVVQIERARKLRLENDEREGRLLDVAKASREAFEFARVLRESVLNVPSRLSAELAAEPDATRVFMRLDAALREALETTAATLERVVNE